MLDSTLLTVQPSNDNLYPTATPSSNDIKPPDPVALRSLPPDLTLPAITDDPIESIIPLSLPSSTRRTCPPRVAKTNALLHLPPILSLPSDSREIPYPQLPKVQLRVGLSKIVGAGTGLFMLKGPRKDGSARKGDKLGTYSGKVYTDPADLERLRSPTFKSDYLWEGVNPFTGQTIIVDASHPHSGYGRYTNDGLGKKEPNVTLAFGEDGVLYLIALVDIEPNSELFLSYGSEYWFDPARWHTLSEVTRRSILIAYPPRPSPATRRSASDTLRDNYGIVFSLPPLPPSTTGDTSSPRHQRRPKQCRIRPAPLPPAPAASSPTPPRSPIMTPMLTPSLLAPPELTGTSDTLIIHSALSTLPFPSTPGSLSRPILPDDSQTLPSPSRNVPSLDSPPIGYLQTQRTACGLAPATPSDSTTLTPSSVPLYVDRDPHYNRRISRLMQKCYGQSSDGNTRISLHSAALPLSQTIRTLLQGACRDEAYARLLPFFQQHACFHYWKRIDYTHYNNSIPNGACGWYTIMQLLHRKTSGRLLDFNHSDDLLEGCSLLRRAILLNPHTTEARNSATYAMEFAT